MNIKLDFQKLNIHDINYIITLLKERDILFNKHRNENIHIYEVLGDKNNIESISKSLLNDNILINYTTTKDETEVELYINRVYPLIGLRKLDTNHSLLIKKYQELDTTSIHSNGDQLVSNGVIFYLDSIFVNDYLNGVNKGIVINSDYFKMPVSLENFINFIFEDYSSIKVGSETEDEDEYETEYEIEDETETETTITSILTSLKNKVEKDFRYSLLQILQAEYVSLIDNLTIINHPIIKWNLDRTSELDIENLIQYYNNRIKVIEKSTTSSNIVEIEDVDEFNLYN